MGDKPIIFSAPMVRALLDGRKTQTRRVLKPQPTLPWGSASHAGKSWWTHDSLTGDVIETWRLRYAVGDRMYVREHWRAPYIHDSKAPRELPSNMVVSYEAVDGIIMSGRFRQGMHMPRWASRLTLTVTDVRVQRLQEISTEDAEAEGCECDVDGWRDYLFPSTQCCGTARESYRTLWNSLHGPDAWGANPWVVAVSFIVQHGNIDQIGGTHD